MRKFNLFNHSSGQGKRQITTSCLSLYSDLPLTCPLQLRYAVVALFVILGVGNMWGATLGTKTVSTTAATTLEDGDIVIMSDGTNYFSGTMTSVSKSKNWVQTTTTKADAFLLKVVGEYNSTTQSYKLQDYDETKGYFKSTSATQTVWDTQSSNATSFTSLVGVDDYIYRYNGSGYRRYNSSQTGTAVSLYKVSITTGPTITTSVSSLSDVGYSTDDFSQQVKSFTVSGSSLTENVTVTAPTNYEVCKTSDGAYASSVSFNPTSGTLAASTVFVRLQSGKTAGNHGGDISCTSAGATNKSVSLSGSVPFTVTWKANGTTHATTYVAYATGAGTALGSLPTEPDPEDYSCTGNAFFGWYDGETYSHASAAPSVISTSTKITSDKTYNAVFAKTSGGSGVTSLLSEDFSSITTGNSTATSGSGTEWTVNSNFSSKERVYQAGGAIKLGGSNNSGYIITKQLTAAIGDQLTISFKVKGWSSVEGDIQISGNNNEFTSPDAITYTATMSGSFEAKSVTVTLTKANPYIKIATTAKRAFIDDIVITKGSAPTYSNYATTCCTPLAQVEGSDIVSQTPTSVQLSWNAVEGAEKYQVKVPGSTSHDNWTDATSGVTVTGLTAGASYTAQFRAVDTDNSNCEMYGEASSLSFTTPKITLGSISGASVYIYEVAGGGSVQTFTVEGVGLTGTELTVTAPSNFEVSTDGGSSWGTSKTIAISNNEVDATVKVRLVEGLGVNSYNGDVTVSGGSAESVNIAVSGTVSPACEAPTINTQPADATYDLNADATALSVEAAKNGTGPALTYQWYSNTENSNSNGTLINGATSSTYIPSTSAAGTKYYYCVVNSGACSASSECAEIVVNQPAITLNKSSIAFGEKEIGGSYQETFTVSGAYMIANIGIAKTGDSEFTIDKTSVVGTGTIAATVITVTYAPTAAGSHSGTLTLTSTGAEEKTVTLSGTGVNLYTVTYNAGTGTCGTASAKQTTADGEVTLPTPTLSDALVSAGWSFAGWKKESAVTSLVTEAPTLFTGTYTPEADETLYAVYKFTEGGTVTDEINHTSVGITGSSYTAWSNKTFTSNAVYAGKSAGGDNNSGNAVQLRSTDSDCGIVTTTSGGKATKVTVEWNDHTTNGRTLDVYGKNTAYTAASDLYGDSKGTKIGSIAKGTSTELEINTDYEFIGLRSNSGAMYLGEIRIDWSTASYSWYSNPSDKVTITYDANGGENAPGAQEDITLGTNPTVADAGTIAKAGHTFSKWNTKADGTGTDYAAGATIEGIKKDVTLYAVWSVNKHKVSVSSIDHITIGATPAGASAIAEGANNGAVAYGTVVTLAQTADAHYTFGDWTVTKDGDAGTVVPVSEGSFTMPDYDVVVSATAPTEDAKRDVVFYSNGVQVGEKMTTYVGEAPATAPTAVYESCLEGSNIFYGWTTETWDNTIDATTLAGKTVYRTLAEIPAVVAGEGDVNYYAVWAKATTTFQKGTSADLKNGQKVVIVHNNSSKALENDGTSWEGADVTINTNQISDPASTIQWTIETTTNGFYLKNGSNQYLKGQNKSGGPYILLTNTTNKWTLTNDGTYVLKDENNRYLEYYSNAFTTFGSYNSNNANCYVMDFYVPVMDDFRTNCCEKKAITLSGVDDEVGKHFESDKEEACEGETVTLTKTEEGFFNFGGWTVYKTGDKNTTVTVTNNQFEMPDYAVTVEAEWNPKNYKATVASEDNNKGTVSVIGGSIDGDDFQVAYGSPLTLTATPVDEDHYFFQNWTVTPAIPELDLTQNPLVITMPGNNIDVTANFGTVAYPALTLETSEAYTLTATLANGDPIADMDMGAIRSGTALKVSYVLNGQNEKTGWTLTPATTYGESENYITFNMPSEALHVALAVRPYYTLGLSAENGSINAVSINSEAQALAAEYCVHEGEDVEVTAVPSDENYKFKEWVKTGDAATYSDASTTATLKVGTENMTLKAVFEAKATYNLTLNALGRTQEVIQALEGTDVASLLEDKNAVTLKGYHFEGWSETEDGEAISDDDALKLNGDKTVYAVYSAEAYYQKVTSASEITDGQYLIVYEDGSLAFDGGLETLDAVGNTIAVTINNGKIASAPTIDAASFTIDVTAGTIKSASGMYIGKTSNSNGMDENENTAYTHTLSIDDDGNFVAVSSGGAYMRYNNGSNQYRFRYFKSETYAAQKAIQLYKKVAPGANESNPTTVVANNEVLVIDADATLNNLTIEAGGKVDGSGNLTVNDFTIEGQDGKSGQVMNANKLTINGDAYFDFTLAVSGTKAANQWHNFSVPFPVSVMDGVYNAETGAKLTNEVDYAIEDYHGDLRAQGKYGWKKYRGIMQPGITYSMTVNGDIQTFRFKKVAGAYSFDANPSVGFSQYNSGVLTDAGWNGLGNMRLCYASVNNENIKENSGVRYVQILDATEYAYKSYAVGEINLTVGSAFFIQAANNGTMTFAAAHNAPNIVYAPARTEAKRTDKPIAVTLSNENQSDRMYITASEDAKSEYQIGCDLQKMFATNTPQAPMIYSVNYGGIKLAAEEAPMVNDKASYALSLYAPADGTYRIETPTESENADLYLTKDGRVIWNLSMNGYEVELTKGTTEGYGLLLVRKAPSVATGVDEPTSDSSLKGRATKVVIDEHVYILRGGQMYDVTGKAVK